MKGSRRAASRKTIWVRSSQGRYPVWIANGLLSEIGRTLCRLRPRCRELFVVSAPRIWELWGREVVGGLQAAGVRLETLLMDDSEQSKRLFTVERLAEELLGRGADRGAVLAALGGGVVGDVAGFLAATYMRGVACLQVPTTVVAQVDSSVGGKTGVNLTAGKNLLGAFSPPLAVLVDPNTLSTLPERDYRAGLYEVVKTAVIGDPVLFRYLEGQSAAVVRREPAALSFLIHRCLRLKAAVVSRDEREQDARQSLNFGHTIGHALEALSGYRLRHGEAVGWGILAASHLAVRLKRLRAAERDRIGTLIAALGPLPPLPPLTEARIYQQLFADKKARQGVLRFVLPRRVGKVEIVANVARQAVLASLSELARVERPR